MVSISYYIYQHIRPDTNQIFYIGIGKTGTKRYISTSGRNKHWKAIVNKNEGIYKSEIIFSDLTREQAIEKETFLISHYGRVNDKSGILVNVLAGGELPYRGPNYLRIYSEEVRAKMSRGHLGNKATLNMMWINNSIKQRLINKTDNVPDGWIKGGLKRPKMSLETRRKMSASKKGKDMGFTKEQRQLHSKNNKSALNYRWYNNGIIDIFIKPLGEIPEGYKKGRLLITNPKGSRISNSLI